MTGKRDLAWQRENLFRYQWVPKGPGPGEACLVAACVHGVAEYVNVEEEFPFLLRAIGEADFTGLKRAIRVQRAYSTYTPVVRKCPRSVITYYNDTRHPRTCDLGLFDPIGLIERAMILKKESTGE